MFHTHVATFMCDIKSVLKIHYKFQLLQFLRILLISVKYAANFCTIACFLCCELIYDYISVLLQVVQLEVLLNPSHVQVHLNSVM